LCGLVCLHLLFQQTAAAPGAQTRRFAQRGSLGLAAGPAGNSRGSRTAAASTITAGRHAGRIRACTSAARAAAAITITAGRCLTRPHRSAPRPAVLAGRPGLQHRRCSFIESSFIESSSLIYRILIYRILVFMLLIYRILVFKRPIYASPLLFEVGNCFPNAICFEVPARSSLIMMRCISRKTSISHRLPCQ
jgi:hypothetical protein